MDVTYLPVDRHGRVDPAEVAAAITPDTVLVTVMHAHNETGTLQPIADIAEVTRVRGVLLHTDAAQSGGKVDLDVHRLGVDLLTVVGHKMYAPRASPPSTSATASPSSHSSAAEGKNTVSAPAPRTSPWPQPSVRPPTWPPEHSGTARPLGSPRCATISTSSSPNGYPVASTFTDTPLVDCPTR